MRATTSTTLSILINKSNVARFFAVSKTIVDRWVRAGKLPKPRRRVGLSKWEYQKIGGLSKFGKRTEPITQTPYPPSPASVPLTWRG